MNWQLVNIILQGALLVYLVKEVIGEYKRSKDMWCFKSTVETVNGVDYLILKGTRGVVIFKQPLVGRQ